MARVPIWNCRDGETEAGWINPPGLRTMASPIVTPVPVLTVALWEAQQ